MESDESTTQTPDDLFRTAVLFESALGGVAILLGWFVGPDARLLVPRIEDGRWLEFAGGLGWGLLAAVPMLLFVAGVRKIPCGPVRQLEELGDDGIFKLLLQLTPLEMILVSICAGVGEELLFRGWLLPMVRGLFVDGGLLNSMGSLDGGANSVIAIGTAVAISSLVFGLVHPITKLYVLITAMIGVYLGMILVWTENLLIPIVAHAAYDAVQMIYSRWADGRESESGGRNGENVAA